MNLLADYPFHPAPPQYIRIGIDTNPY